MTYPKVFIQNEGSPSEAQSAWHIDSVNGNDGYTGLDSSHKIATCAEFCRRVAPSGVYKLEVNTDVYIYNDTALSDFMTFILEPLGDVYLRIHGVPTSTTFTTNAVTNKNVSTPVMPTVSAAGLGSSHVGKLLKLNTGTQYAWSLANPSGTILRTTNWVAITLGSLAMTSGNPSNADTLTVYTLPKLTAGAMRFNNGPVVSYYFDNIQVGDNNERMRIDAIGGNLYFNNCILDGCRLSCSAAQIQGSNCLFKQDFATIDGAGGPSFYAGGIFSDGGIRQRGSSQLFLDYDFCIEGVIFVGVNTGKRGSSNIITSSSLALFAQSGDAIHLTNGALLSNVNLSSGSIRIWGLSAGYSINGDKGSNIQYTAGSIPTATGTSGDMQLGGFGFSWSEAPFADPLSGCKVEEL